MNLRNRGVSYLSEMKKIIYADHAATTRLSDNALAAMRPYLENVYHNPSTLYTSASQPRNAINAARCEIANMIGANSREIYFTSGGTESDNWAIKNVFFSCTHKKKKIVTSKIEHHAILNSCIVMERLGYEVIYLPVDRYGVVQPEVLKSVIDENTALVSIMYANNEIGSIQNITELAEISHQNGAWFHTDAVQAVGHLNIDVREIDVDFLSASAHKFNGPKGVGFLYARQGIELSPLIIGGSQENGKRAGTENVAGIVGMSTALRENVENIEANTVYLEKLSNFFVEQLKATGIDFIINGACNRIPGNLSISFFDTDGEMILHRLDLKGIEVATGSACNSIEKQISHVIKAIAVPEIYAGGTIRLSFGIDNTENEISVIVRELEGILQNR